MIDKIRAAFFGLAIGDALGVPVEFKSREELSRFPVVAMQEFGTWQQPRGTWSDDSSLAFCLAESLTKGYNVNDIAQNFINWYSHGYWGAHHKVFDVGGATRAAISRLMQGVSPVLAGGLMEDDNGNGSLMRILPLLFSITHLNIEQQYHRVKEVSSITHAHFRSVFACFIYMQVANNLLLGKDAKAAYTTAVNNVNNFIAQHDFAESEIRKFDRILQHDIAALEESSVFSGGYVVHTLEASLWCLLNTNIFDDAVLKAVNLGGDTDTTACVTGGLAGLLYGIESIPEIWIDTVARTNDIEDLCGRLAKNVS